jgi:hypothetical protein
MHALGPAAAARHLTAEIAIRARFICAGPSPVIYCSATPRRLGRECEAVAEHGRREARLCGYATAPSAAVRGLAHRHPGSPCSHGKAHTRSSRLSLGPVNPAL